MKNITLKAGNEQDFFHRGKVLSRLADAGQPIPIERTVSIESLPKFTEPAAKLWANVPAAIKKQLLANVWCGKCRDGVTITNFTGTVKAGDLLLVGVCAECRGDVARVIEMDA